MGFGGASIRRPCRWRRIRVAAAVVVSLTAAASGRGQAPMMLLEDLAGTLREQPAWTAAYHQEYLPAGMTDGEQIDGEVWVAWPDRALFQSGDPVVRLMGLDRRRVRLVDLDVPSCEDHRLSDDEWARIPLAVVLDPKAAVDSFTVIDLGNRSFALVPREPGGVSRVEVVLGSDSLPDRVVVVDPQGASNRLDFDDWRPVAAPPSGAWLPERPAGVSCSGEGSELDPAGSDERGRLRR
jgi:hypothetical protein